MRCTHCQRCCRETRMELCAKDMEQLEKRGYPSERFSELAEDGIFRLVNVNGFCFFYDTRAHRCSEYQYRPLGCRIYPVNVDCEGKIVIDSICPASSSISAGEMKRKGEQMTRLLDTIDGEADSRLR